MKFFVAPQWVQTDAIAAEEQGLLLARTVPQLMVQKLLGGGHRAVNASRLLVERGTEVAQPLHADVENNRCGPHHVHVCTCNGFRRAQVNLQC